MERQRLIAHPEELVIGTRTWGNRASCKAPASRRASSCGFEPRIFLTRLGKRISNALLEYPDAVADELIVGFGFYQFAARRAADRAFRYHSNLLFRVRAEDV